MGSSQRFIKWLSMRRNRIDAPPVQQVIMGLKLFNRQLERQVKRMQSQEENARAKAEERKERNDPNGTRRLMKSALQYKKWLEYLDQFRFDLDDMNFQLTTAQDMNNYDQVGEALLRLLCNFKLRMGMPDVQRMFAELDVGFGNMAPVYNDFIRKEKLDENVQPIQVSEKELAMAMGEKGEPEPTPPKELSLEEILLTEDELPPSSESSSPSDSEITDLEAEIRKLRNKRNKRK